MNDGRTMTDFDRINEYLYVAFTMLMMDKTIVIDLLTKHYTSRNYYHTVKIKELYNYFTQEPPYTANETFLTKEEFYNLYITAILNDIYYFEADTENPHAEEQASRYKVFITDVKNVIYNKSKNKKKAISATIKRLVWNTNIGEDIGKAKCLCCKATDITQMSFNCGHIVAEANGGDTIVSNLKPICQNCNSSMATKNMEEFMKSLI